MNQSDNPPVKMQKTDGTKDEHELHIIHSSNTSTGMTHSQSLLAMPSALYHEDSDKTCSSKSTHSTGTVQSETEANEVGVVNKNPKKSWKPMKMGALGTVKATTKETHLLSGRNEEYSDISEEDDMGKAMKSKLKILKKKIKVEPGVEENLEVKQPSVEIIDILDSDGQGSDHRESISDSEEMAQIKDMSQSEIEQALVRIGKVISGREGKTYRIRLDPESETESVGLTKRKTRVKKMKRNKTSFDFNKLFAPTIKSKSPKIKTLEGLDGTKRPIKKELDVGIEQSLEQGNESEAPSTSKAAKGGTQSGSMTKASKVQIGTDPKHGEESRKQVLIDSAKKNMLKDLKSIENRIKQLELNPVKIRATEVCPEIRKIADPHNILGARLAKWEAMATEVVSQAWIQEAVGAMATIERKYRFSIKEGSENFLKISNETRNVKRNG